MNVFDPLFQAIGGLLAFFYGIVPSYAAAIALLTVAVMLCLYPLTKKQTKSMVMMAKLAPEAAKLKKEFKDDRQRLNEETMKLYTEHGANPLMGCLPILLQSPVFIVLYQTVFGLSKRQRINGELVSRPKHVEATTSLYQDIVADGGRLLDFGVDLAKSARESLGDGFGAAPFLLLIAAVVGTSYFQQYMISKRNPPAASDNPLAQQMQMMAKFTPIMFGFISFNVQAGVVVYFLVSNVFRIVQQWWMFKTDPVLRDREAPLPRKTLDTSSTPIEEGADRPELPAKAPKSTPSKGRNDANGSTKNGASRNGANGRAGGNGKSANGKGGAVPPQAKTSGRVTAPGTANRSKKKSKRGR